MELLRHLLFEDPLSLWIVLGIVALVSLGVWARFRSEKALWATAGCVLAGIALAVLAWAVETDRENIIRTLDIMAAAIERGDATAFNERISPAYKNGPSGTKERLAAIVEVAIKRVHVSAVGDPFIDLKEGEAVVQQDYTFQYRIYRPGPVGEIGQAIQPVTWEGAFAPDADGEWRLRSATAIKPQQITPEEASRFVTGAGSI
jgi:hypothetical protein